MEYLYRRDHHSGANTREAQRVAAEILGKPLPPNAEVHHKDGDPANNEPSNLVICRDNSQHKQLHVKIKALKACGHEDGKRCWICEEYDEPENLEPVGRSFQHKECARQYRRERPVQNFCCYCKEQDLPENLQVNKANGQCYHKECVTQYRQLQRVQQGVFTQKGISAINNFLEGMKGGD